MILHGDCLIKLKDLADNSVDSIVTDPPYGLSFMGKSWDYDVPTEEIWRECLRVLKPGGHLLAFFGTRTYHKGVVRIEDAGFEIRDMIAWNYGSGFPKNLDIQKAAIKANIACGCTESNSQHNMRFMQQSDLSETFDFENQSGQILQPFMQEQVSSEQRAKGCSDIWEGKSILEGRQLPRANQRLSNDSDTDSSQGQNERLCIGTHSSSRENLEEKIENSRSCTSYKSQSVGQSSGKFENISEPQSPLDGPSFSRCPKCQKTILQKGLGTALKPANEPIVVARKPLEKKLTVAENVIKWGTGAINIDESRISTGGKSIWKVPDNGKQSTSLMCFDKPGDGSDSMFKNKGGREGSIQGRWPANIIFDEEAAALLDEQSGVLKSGELKGYKSKESENVRMSGKNYAREFNKSTKSEGGASRFFYVAKASKSERNEGLDGISNGHPTIKPVRLMQYLIKLVTPPSGTILDPFMGSGSTGVAAKKLGFDFIGIEMNEEYFEIAKRRIEHAEKIQFELSES